MLLTACVQRAPRNDATMPFGKVYSGPRKAIAATDPALNRANGGLPSLVFTKLSEWISGSNTVITLRGMGAAGKPAVEGDYRWRIVEYVSRFHTDTINGGTYDEPRQYNGLTAMNLASRPAKPATRVEYTYHAYGNIRNTYDYEVEQYYTGAEATTGTASNMVLGATNIFVFPGGDGGPASITTFNNITILPDTKYIFQIPVGGYIEVYGAK